MLINGIYTTSEKSEVYQNSSYLIAHAYSAPKHGDEMYKSLDFGTE
jgi:hypothetical protein